jgi:hypothetical protein
MTAVLDQAAAQLNQGQNQTLVAFDVSQKYYQIIYLTSFLASHCDGDTRPPNDERTLALYDPSSDRI